MSETHLSLKIKIELWLLARDTLGETVEALRLVLYWGVDSGLIKLANFNT